MTDPIEIELLEASIARVWNEHDAGRRLAAIGDIYHHDAIIHEPARSVTGHDAISDVVGALLADMPADFRFEITGPTLGHHGVAVTRWKGGPPGQILVSGADAASIREGKIYEHWFFFDPVATE